MQTATERAIVKADEQMSEYSIIRAGSGLNHLFHVIHGKDTNRAYLVNTRRESCTCSAHERNGVCKHRVMVHYHEQIEAGEDAAEYGQYGI